VLTATDAATLGWATPATGGGSTGGAQVLLIDNAASLPVGTPAGVIVVVKGASS